MTSWEIKDRLVELDKRYLTPRVLAGLAIGDEFAAAQLARHNAEAEPLRARLRELKKTGELAAELNGVRWTSVV